MSTGQAIDSGKPEIFGVEDALIFLHNGFKVQSTEWAEDEYMYYSLDNGGVVLDERGIELGAQIFVFNKEFSILK